MAVDFRVEKNNPFSRVAVVLLALAVAASAAALNAGVRWSLLPIAVLFGWTQIGGV